MFQYPLNLHCSQTTGTAQWRNLSFNTLWIYTALKPLPFYNLGGYVSIPSEFTLLSNTTGTVPSQGEFQYPLNLHCSQTFARPSIIWGRFQYPLNLHCSQTNYQTFYKQTTFQYPLNLHCSQTVGEENALSSRFQYPLNLHCSQTPMNEALSMLKFQYPLNLHCSQTCICFDLIFSKFQYPLNLHCSQTQTVRYNFFSGFNTLWIYTALKPLGFSMKAVLCFNTLWIYTALKQDNLAQIMKKVSIPSEFTLLSNAMLLL